jgi:uncharacterized membrane protein YtjA (UPF0391 family)
MLNWVLTFFVLSLVAGILGFSGLALQIAGVAKILFVIFLVLLAGSFLAHRGRTPLV